ncbi:MAG: glycogen debranching enzyme GlgX, partial [Gammaproteobacteria bacterium]|nr:glycogen debranching enzyme GlgX [Gammaproteobacteria bacterium]
RFSRSDELAEVRRMVDRFHDANIEVVLDVVYNHTAEGGKLGPSLSFRGLANATYYRLAALDAAEYINDTGCGNTINSDAPMTRRLIVDSLRYWANEIGIDGFRFDLATILGRRASGFDRSHPLFAEIRSDPALAGTKLIAEPWDVGPGGYRLGGFPEDWAEWNDQFRDTVRRFWAPEPGRAPDFARRVHGSADIFELSGRGPGASINFIASHDGFTAADLVSYVDRHNEANGEDNRDGHAHNFSVNYGVEGPSGDEYIIAERRRHRLNLLATLLFSQGTPMLLAGDEFGNSQQGNNNAYAQDNEIGWLDWSGLASDPAFAGEVAAMTAIRKELTLLRQTRYRHGDPAPSTGHGDIEWFNVEGRRIAEDEWGGIMALGVLFSLPADDPGGPALAVAIIYNSSEAAASFSLPPIESAGHWTCRYATSEISLTGDRIELARRSLACIAFTRREA